MARDGAGLRAEDRPPAPDLHGRPHARLRGHRPPLTAGAYRVTVRFRGGTQRERHPTLDAALRALEAHLDTLVTTDRRGTESVLSRDYEPVRQVAARGELAGPRRLRAGVDLRGDGSAEAFTGRWRKRLVDRPAGETAYDALRRAIGAAAS